MNAQDFKIGDRVRRINRNNGGAAKVGQEAVVIGRRHDLVVVRYPGCDEDNYAGGGEGWWPYNVEKVAYDTPATSWLPQVGDEGKTRDGRDYEVVYVDETLDENYQVYAKVAGGDILCSYARNGRFTAQGRDNVNDLMPPKRTVYVNFYRRGNCLYFVNEADALASTCLRDCPPFATAVPVDLP